MPSQHPPPPIRRRRLPPRIAPSSGQINSQLCSWLSSTADTRNWPPSRPGGRRPPPKTHHLRRPPTHNDALGPEFKRFLLEPRNLLRPASSIAPTNLRVELRSSSSTERPNIGLRVRFASWRHSSFLEFTRKNKERGLFPLFSSNHTWG